jgi:hypothetical protein
MALVVRETVAAGEAVVVGAGVGVCAEENAAIKAIKMKKARDRVFTRISIWGRLRNF